jgi:hypothetical protein
MAGKALFNCAVLTVDLTPFHDILYSIVTIALLFPISSCLQI